MSGQRSSIEIMSDILEVAMKERQRQYQTDGGVPVSKRELMRSANLNYNQLMNYLDTLEQKEFIIRSETDQGLFLEITDKGADFFEQASNIKSLLNRD